MTASTRVNGSEPDTDRKGLADIYEARADHGLSVDCQPKPAQRPGRKNLSVCDIACFHHVSAER